MRPVQIENLASRYPRHKVVMFASRHLEGIKVAPLDYSMAVATFVESLGH